MKRIQRVGFFDSGFGGLTVLKEVQRILPQLDYIYLGDTARVPYGSRSPAVIQRYSHECARFLMTKEIDLLVVACNTVSACALNQLQEQCPFPVIGTVEPAVLMALGSTHSAVIGVIGTDATIGSGVYDHAIRARAPSATVYSTACPLFTPLVEQGMLHGEIVEKIVELYLAAWRSLPIDCVVLGCTHYPLLRGVLQQFLGNEVAIVECSKAIAEEVRKLVAGSSSSEIPKGTTDYFVTDDVHRFNRLGRIFLDGVDVNSKQVEVY